MTRREGRLLGQVTLHEPTDAKPYYRLTYVDATGRRRHASGSADPVRALEKVDEINASLTAARLKPAGPTLGDLVAEYISTPQDRKRSKTGRLLNEDWKPNHFTAVRQDMRRAVKGVEDVAAAEVDRATVDHMRSACGTPAMVDQMTRAVRGFLYWAQEAGALSEAQAELLPPGARRTVRPRFPQPERRPRRRQRVRVQGRDERYVGEEDAPSRSAVCAFAAALQAEKPWGALAVHTATGTGVREGELFQLTAYDLDVDPADDELYINIDWQWCSDAGRRTLPKGDKRRPVPVSAITAENFRLRDGLLERKMEALAEQGAGTNPEALLFPTERGKIWHTGALSRLLVKAQTAAGWKYVMVNETRTTRDGERKVVRVTQMEQTWHSLRHRFARDMIADGMPADQLMAIGGWESIDVVNTRYFRTGEEHVRGAAATIRRASSSRESGPTA